ncbi:unnamed protein product [Dibothriocephalus latus]|uniref:Uncharacterized protein n=1 Tax=Dibothriocephalus latus TaxID=60516 RepID=A0A3P7P6X5_DIBLA|nr:unnamed protein product [Dibothriocephalus latus]
MIILTVIMVGYAVAAQSIAYPNGYYTSENMVINGTVQGMQFIDTIFAMYTTAYFQMFGDFSLDALQGEGTYTTIFSIKFHDRIRKCAVTPIVLVGF